MNRRNTLSGHRPCFEMKETANSRARANQALLSNYLNEMLAEPFEAFTFSPALHPSTNLYLWYGPQGTQGFGAEAVKPVARWMSALGHKRTFAAHKSMSAKRQ